MISVKKKSSNQIILRNNVRSIDNKRYPEDMKRGVKYPEDTNKREVKSQPNNKWPGSLKRMLCSKDRKSFIKKVQYHKYKM